MLCSNCIRHDVIFTLCNLLIHLIVPGFRWRNQTRIVLFSTNVYLNPTHEWEFFFWAEVEDEKITHRKKKTRECFIRMTCVADTIEWIYTLSVLCGYFKIPEYFSLAFSQFIFKFLRNYFV